MKVFVRNHDGAPLMPCTLPKPLSSEQVHTGRQDACHGE